MSFHRRDDQGTGRHRATGSTGGPLGAARLLRVVGVVAAASALVAAVTVPVVLSATSREASVGRGVVEARDAAPTPISPTPTATPATPTGPPTLKQLDRRFRAEGMVRVAAKDLKPWTFRVASYNVLGASHTQGAKARRGFAGHAARTPGQVSLLEAHDVSVVGLQEFQHPQANHWRSLRGSTYATYPGLSLGERLSQNSIAWRTDTWELVEGRTTPIPYFGGNRVPMPHVLLRHLESGRTVWFGNYHNPANIGGNHAGWRREALTIEANLAKSLGADGTPVVMTGDFNDRAEFACPFSALSGMRSPDGAATVSGRCQTPAKMSVDWIFGTPDITWSAYAQDWSSRDRRLSDHPVIVATATVASAHDASKCLRARAKAGKKTYCPKV